MHNKLVGMKIKTSLLYPQSNRLAEKAVSIRYLLRKNDDFNDALLNVGTHQ